MSLCFRSLKERIKQALPEDVRASTYLRYVRTLALKNGRSINLEVQIKTATDLMEAMQYAQQPLKRDIILELATIPGRTHSLIAEVDDTGNMQSSAAGPRKLTLTFGGVTVVSHTQES